MKRHLKNSWPHEMYIGGRVCKRTNRTKDVQSQVTFWVLWETLLTLRLAIHPTCGMVSCQSEPVLGVCISIRRMGHLAHLLTHSTLQELPTFVHGSKLLGKIGLITAFALHILAADLQHRLVHKVRCQLLTVQVYPETLRERRETQITRFHVQKSQHVPRSGKVSVNPHVTVITPMMSSK